MQAVADRTHPVRRDASLPWRRYVKLGASGGAVYQGRWNIVSVRARPVRTARFVRPTRATSSAQSGNAGHFRLVKPDLQPDSRHRSLPMSTLDLIRSLRRALNELRDARDPDAAEAVARELANELYTKLTITPPSEPDGWLAAQEHHESGLPGSADVHHADMAAFA
jgi:hypothetical protein